jgi:magnesium-transporting ATPase (P-type)
MDNEQNGTSFFIALLRRFGGAFSVTILVITITGILLARCDVNVRDTINLFASGGNGLAYEAILQLAAFSALIAFFSVLLFDEWFLPKLRFLRRAFVFMLLVIVTASIFVIIFKWFPTDDILAWLSFILLTVACFAVSFGLTMLKAKREGKKYGKLLAEYKARHGK